MTIDKWISKETSKNDNDKNKDNSMNYRKGSKTLTEKKKEDLVRERISNVLDQRNTSLPKEAPNISQEDYFLKRIIEFYDWLNNRIYLQGDRGKIKQWITSLYKIIEEEKRINSKMSKSDGNREHELNKKFRTIPPRLIDEKTRVALQKKLRWTETTSSDDYYLRKLKTEMQEKLKELKYLKILKDIIQL